MRSLILVLALVSGLYTALRPVLVQARALAVVERGAVPLEVYGYQGGAR